LAQRIARLSIEGVGSSFLVSRKTLQIVVLVCLVAFALAYPAIESLDHWDAANPACDSELEAIVALTFAGSVFLVTLVVAAFPVYGTIQRRADHLRSCALCAKHGLFFSPHLSPSPPVALRI
jgi:hypothetical protein